MDKDVLVAETGTQKGTLLYVKRPPQLFRQKYRTQHPVYIKILLNPVPLFIYKITSLGNW